jgi:hypothetical protein
MQSRGSAGGDGTSGIVLEDVPPVVICVATQRRPLGLERQLKGLDEWRVTPGS